MKRPTAKTIVSSVVALAIVILHVAALLLSLFPSTAQGATTRIIKQTAAASISVSALIEACMDSDKVIWVMGVNGDISSPVVLLRHPDCDGNEHGELLPRLGEKY